MLHFNRFAAAAALVALSVTAAHFQQCSSCWTRSLPDPQCFCYNNIIGKQKYFSHSLSPEPTAVGAGSSAIAVHVMSRLWLFLRIMSTPPKLFIALPTSDPRLDGMSSSGNDVIYASIRPNKYKNEMADISCRFDDFVRRIRGTFRVGCRVVGRRQWP